MMDTSHSRISLKKLVNKTFPDTPVACYEIIKEFLAAVKSELLNGNEVSLSTIGSFKVKQRQIYNAFDDDYQIIKTISFLPVRILKQQIQGD